MIWAIVTSSSGAVINTHSSHVAGWAIAEALRQAFDRWVNSNERYAVEVHDATNPSNYPYDLIERIEFSGPLLPPQSSARSKQYQWNFVPYHFRPDSPLKTQVIAAQSAHQIAEP